MTREADLIRFYTLLDRLQQDLGGTRRLDACSGRMAWPLRGIYFFHEEGERRSDTGTGPRVVRVGTHALKAESRTTLWSRLSQHQGSLRTGGGNHRGSIFRLLIGTSLGRPPASWGIGASAPSEVRHGEVAHEREVSSVLRAMPFLWLGIDDAPGPGSLRGFIERNAIALLSNFGRTPIDPPSTAWLGRYCSRERVRASGLWNNNHVDETHDPTFLDVLENLVGEATDESRSR